MHKDSYKANELKLRGIITKLVTEAVGNSRLDGRAQVAYKDVSMAARHLGYPLYSSSQ